MNDIVYPMKVHAVKLEYRRLLLEKIPHGYFKMKKGRQYVIVTFDPEKPKYNSRHPRILLSTTELGVEYTNKIISYQEIKNEYDGLLINWYANYSFAPPRVTFPIKQFYDPHCMNNAFYNNQAGCCGKYKPDNPTVSKHGEFKSKNEQMGADLLEQMGIPFKYETQVYLSTIGETINPDYLANFYEIDRCSYIEILGMNDKGNYSVNTATKINGFSLSGYRPGREVIYVLLYDKQNFDEEYFISQVMSAFNDMIPKSALIWEEEKAV